MFASLKELGHKVVHDVWGDDANDYKLLRKCFATLPETVQPSIPRLYQYVHQNPNERVSDILIRILGYLSYQIVRAKLEKNCAVLDSHYPDKLQTIFENFLVILSYPRDKLANDLHFTWISPQDYSDCTWSQDHAITAVKTPAELLRTGLALGVLIWPMPRPLAHLLDLNRVSYIGKGLDNLETRSAQMVADIYAYLVPVENDTPFAFTFPINKGKNADLGREEKLLELTDAEKALRREECLLRFAAFAGFPNLNSWMDEILLWGKKYNQMEKVRGLFKALKLTHLLIDKQAKEILGIIIPEPTSAEQPPVAQRKPPVVASISAPAEHEQPLQSDQKPLSFQDYLIQKSLNLLKTEFSLSDAAYAELENLFKSKESERIHVLFVVYAFNVSSQPEEYDFYRLKEMMQASYPPNNSSSFFTYHLTVYKTLFQSFDSKAAQYAKAFLVLFLLKHRFKMDIPRPQQALLIDYFSKLYANNAQNMICGLEDLLSRLPLTSLNSLSTLSHKRDSPPEFFRHLIWELYVRSHLPSTCWEDLIALHSKLSPDDSVNLRLCVYQWFKLYPNHQRSLSMDATLTFLDGKLPGDVAQYFSFDHSFAEGLKILDTHFSPQASNYPLLHATLCFIYWNYYLSFSNQIHNTLFTLIQKTSVENRTLCIESWLKFGNCLSIESTLQEARAQVLKEAYTKKVDAWPNEKLSEYLSDWPKPLEHFMNFQLEFLQRVENLIQVPIPLMTYFMFFCYCPALPADLKMTSPCTTLVDDLQHLKASLKLHNFNSLFIFPSWITPLDAVTQLDMLDRFVTALYYLQGGRRDHVNLLPHYIEGIKTRLSSSILPSLSFRKDLCQQIGPLFKSSNKFFPALQNRVLCYTSDPTCAEEWHDIGYRMKWKLAEHPVLSMTIWESFYQLQSREIHFNLEIPIQKLNPTLYDLLDKLLALLEEEITEIRDPTRLELLTTELKNLKNRQNLDEDDQQRLEYLEIQLNPEKYLNTLNSAQEELDFCLKFYRNELKHVYQTALVYSSNEEILNLFKFVRELKIQTRKEQAFLRQQERDRQAYFYTWEWLAGQGHVYSTGDGLSLVPPYFDDVPSFYCISTEETNALTPILILLIRTAENTFEMPQLLTLALTQDVQAKVSLSFAPYLDAEFEPDGKEILSYLQKQNMHPPAFKRLEKYDQVKVPPKSQKTPENELEKHLKEIFSPVSFQKALTHIDNYVEASGTFEAFLEAFSKNPRSSYDLFPLFKAFIHCYPGKLEKDDMKQALQICAKHIGSNREDLEDLKEFVLETGDIWLAEQLYKQGWNVHLPLEISEDIPLVRAVQCQQPALVVWLLLKGTDPALKGTNNLSALDEAQKLEKKGSNDFTVANSQKIRIGYSNSQPNLTKDDLKQVGVKKELAMQEAQSLQKIGQDLTKLLQSQREIKDHFLRINEVTFKLEGHDIVHSCKWLNFVDHPNLKNFMDWQLLQLKSHYHAAQRHSLETYNWTFLGAEERLAPDHLQTDSFDNLKLQALILKSCEPLAPLILHQDPPFKLSLVDAKALYKESPVKIQLAPGQFISVETDPEYQQLERFIPTERPPNSRIGASFVNNYPNNNPGGQINCDTFYVQQGLPFTFAILADGCSFGNKPRVAAQRAVAGVVAYLHQSLSHSLYTLKTAQELACILVRSLANAHDNILKEKRDAAESGTTTINICFEFKDANQQKHLMTVGVGDSKAFLVLLDENYRVVDVANRQHLNHNITDPGGRLGPYNGNDGHAEAHHPDLRNLSISCCPLPENSIVFNMSDGGHDNFDPEVLQIPPYTIDNTIEKSKLWTTLKKENLERYESLKSTYQAECLGNLVRKAIEAGKQTVDEICQEITSYCHQVTENKRKPMEDDPNLNEPYEPGKLDHCSIVAFRG